MKKLLIKITFLCLCLVLVVAHTRMQTAYSLPYPSLNQLIGRDTQLQDSVIMTFGFRRLAADIAWIQLLQGMGSEDKFGKTDTSCPYLKIDTLRILRIDPYFHSAAVFGAISLAWLKTIDRPVEAMEILNEAIQYSPKYWPYRTYMVAIGLKVDGQFDAMVSALEQVLDSPECPALIKVIIANSYKKRGEYQKALIIWDHILSLPTAAEYHARAKEQIQLIKGLMHGS